jgi:anti-sigma factor RsiW
MITCRQLIDLLIDYVSDELPPEAKAHIQEHLDLCPPCVAYIDTYKLTIQLTRELPAKPMPPQLVERLKKALADIARDPKTAHGSQGTRSD